MTPSSFPRYGASKFPRAIHSDFPGDSTFLLELDIQGEELTVTGFLPGSRGQAEAQRAYEEAEARNADRQNVDAVLVAAESMEALRRAYPNYFADTTTFRSIVEEAIA